MTSLIKWSRPGKEAKASCLMCSSPPSRTLRCGPIRAKAISTENWSAGRRLKRYRVDLPTLVTRNLELLPLPSASRASEISTTRFPAGFTSLRMCQVSFLIVFLLAFAEGEGASTFRTCDFDVRHGSSLHESRCESGSALNLSERRDNLLYGLTLGVHCGMSSDSLSYRLSEATFRTGFR